MPLSKNKNNIDVFHLGILNFYTFKKYVYCLDYFHNAVFIGLRMCLPTTEQGVSISSRERLRMVGIK